MLFFRRVGRSGHSLYVSIPPPFANALGLKTRDQVGVRLVNGWLQVYKVKEQDIMPDPTLPPDETK